jgi:hypothetical protein
MLHTIPNFFGGISSTSQSWVFRNMYADVRRFWLQEIVVLAREGWFFEMAVELFGVETMAVETFEMESFAFHFSSKSYRCASLLAAFISPRIARYHMNDPTLSEYQMNTVNNTDIFENVLKLSGGYSVDIEENETAFLLSICQALENDELSLLLFDKVIGTSSLSVDNMYSRFRLKYNMSCGICDGVRFIRSLLFRTR